MKRSTYVFMLDTRYENRAHVYVGGCRDKINVGVELEDSLNDTSDSCIVIHLDAELTPDSA
jgi:hypothetical protein